MTTEQSHRRVLALCGGIGGAKLALGLYGALDRSLTVAVNTGDDFEHLGLYISPDIDTVLYTLSGLSDQQRGWGRADETWHFMQALAQLGGETWFQLGDADLAMHVERTRRLRGGETLTQIVRDVAQRIGITAEIIPMSDDPVRTIVETAAGDIAFQRYFVEQRCEPAIKAIRFEGADHAKASPALLAALRDPRLAAIVICPSNPYLSVDPILAVKDIRAALKTTDVPVIAVSPIIAGRAVKGPTAKIMAELSIPATSQAIADHYQDLIDGLIIDESDAQDRSALRVPVHVASTLMLSLADKRRLAEHVITFAAQLADAKSARAGRIAGASR